MKQWWRLVVQFKKNPIDPDLEWLEESCLDITPEECLQNFNNSLRPGEQTRQLIAAFPIKKDIPKEHEWEKYSLVTEIGGYDRYRCKKCGMFGKRYGLSDFIIPDKKGPCKG